MPEATDSRPEQAPRPDSPETASKGELVSPRVLLVEDEPGIVDFVRRGLEADGLVVETALDGVSGERLALGGDFDAVVLDLMLPGRSGLEILQTVRSAKPSMPVIVLTARGEVEDRVAGLNAGAVDYLVKPFSLAELVARVRAQLRVVEQASASSLRAEDIEVNLLTRKAHRGGRPITLSTTEFELLAHLLRHHGQVLSREQILSAVWGYEHDPATNVVDVYVGYLRRKLGQPGDPAPIFTVRLCRLSPRQHELSNARARRSPRAGWPALAAGGMGNHRGARLHGHLFRGRLRRHGHAGATADRQRDLRRCRRSGTRPGALGRPTPTRVARAADSYVHDQSFAASSTVLFTLVPSAATSTNRPELFLATRPTTARRVAEQGQENRLSRKLLDDPRRLLDAVAARCRRPARAQALGAPASAACVDDGRRWRAAIGVKRAQAGVARAFILAGVARTALGLLLASYLIGSSRLAPAAAHGRGRRARRCRRPASAYPRSRQPGARGAGAHRRLQPHARPPDRGVRGSASVRRRRLARAANSADGDPRAAGTARRPERSVGWPTCVGSSISFRPRLRA